MAPFEGHEEECGEDERAYVLVGAMEEETSGSEQREDDELPDLAPGRALPVLARQRELGEALLRASEARVAIARGLVDAMEAQALSVDAACVAVERHYPRVLAAWEDFARGFEERQPPLDEALAAFDEAAEFVQGARLHPGVTAALEGSRGRARRRRRGRARRAALVVLGPPEPGVGDGVRAGRAEHAGRAGQPGGAAPGRGRAARRAARAARAGARGRQRRVRRAARGRAAAAVGRGARGHARAGAARCARSGGAGGGARGVRAALRADDEAAAARGAAGQALLSTHARRTLPRLFALARDAHDLVEEAAAQRQTLSTEAAAQLRLVAEAQRRMRELGNRLALYREALERVAAAVARLAALRRVPAAYKQCLAEALRRRTFQERYARYVAALADKVAEFRAKEAATRGRFRAHVEPYIPVAALEALGLAGPPPQCHISVTQEPGPAVVDVRHEDVLAFQLPALASRGGAGGHGAGVVSAVAREDSEASGSVAGPSVGNSTAGPAASASVGALSPRSEGAPTPFATAPLPASSSEADRAESQGPADARGDSNDATSGPSPALQVALEAKEAEAAALAARLDDERRGFERRIAELEALLGEASRSDGTGGRADLAAQAESAGAAETVAQMVVGGDVEEAEREVAVSDDALPAAPPDAPEETARAEIEGAVESSERPPEEETACVAPPDHADHPDAASDLESEDSATTVSLHLSGSSSSLDEAPLPADQEESGECQQLDSAKVASSCERATATDQLSTSQAATSEEEMEHGTGHRKQTAPSALVAPGGEEGAHPAADASMCATTPAQQEAPGTDPGLTSTVPAAEEDSLKQVQE
ncbi:hypothetical protein QBZ16_003485 [Prototheca wickerhamii]|uniref:Autophagy protein ATG17-like domain-containing protein n=1 Tax=Prototheca wickerhamii TaxID=3111 RepID=A0AAD9MKT4_PROWI|nr:hypothetical protein QBZ16_003485 [Prototheca wickerhamii]